MTTAPIWLSEAEVVSLIDMGEAIQAVEHGFRAEANGSASNLLKTHLALPGGSVHSLGATLLSDDVVGVKSWAHTPGGASPLLTLWRASDGALLAVIEAFALGQYRTAAVQGAASHAMARPDASRLAILGTGQQALTQVGAVNAVRRLSHVRVWSPTETHRRHFAEAVADALRVPTSTATSPEEACEDADIVTLVTRATAPFLPPDAVQPGSHVNALGAITPERCEFDAELLQRCGLVVADSIAQTRALSREFREFYGDDDDAWSRVVPLSAVAGHDVARPDDADVTLFKAMGVGVGDVSIGFYVYQQALENRLGTLLSAPDSVKTAVALQLIPPRCGLCLRKDTP